MKPETRDTVLMILRADHTVTQPLMDAILKALDGGEAPEVLHVKEVARRMKVTERHVFNIANSGLIQRVPGVGKRAIGFTRASVDNYLLARSIENERRLCSTRCR